MKVKIKPKKILPKILIIIAILSVISIILVVSFRQKLTTAVYYRGKAYTFRQDVKAAEKIPVYPNDKTLRDLFWDYKIKNITILYNPAINTSGFYQVEAFELTYKLSQIYMSLYPLVIQKNFGGQEIASYDNITREEGVLKIVLIPPAVANDTYVRVGGNRVFISGKTYREFDLATIKTILSVMGNYTVI
jgi:hypothetical protein